jgi:hypothetical protein
MAFDMKIKKNLENIFIEQTEEQQNLPGIPVSHEVQKSENFSVEEISKDENFVRNNLIHLSEKSAQLAEISIESLSEEVTPRKIEAASLAFKTAAEISEKLLQLHKQEKQAAVQIVNTDSGVIHLSSAELLKELKNGN